MHDPAGQIIDHYERHALAWDADRRALEWREKPWHDRFVAALPPAAQILDLGCGSGSPVAAHLAEHGHHVTGIDTSPTLVSLCRERLPGHEWQVADMRSLQLPQQFNGILAWDSFFHLTPDDQRLMFSVFARHARPSSVLMFNTGPTHGEAIGEYRGDPLYHASLSPGEYIILLKSIGFEIIAHAAEDWQTAAGRTVWLTRAPRSVGGAKRNPRFSELKK